MASSASEPRSTAPACRPLIGLTTYDEVAVMLCRDTGFAMLHRTYVDAVEQAGGVAVLLPPQVIDDSGADALMQRLDGLVLCGGADVDPERYGESRGNNNNAPRLGRDEWETRLLRGAERLNVPVLSICRGMQLLNVSRGGTLQKHLPDVLSSTEHQPYPGEFGSVAVTVEPTSLLAGAIDDLELKAACHHHQAIGQLGTGLTITASAADGTPEAVEDPSKHFLLGVQWHPEQRGAGPQLFRALVEAAVHRTDPEVPHP